MPRPTDRETVLYPVLGTDVADLWFFRLSGWGLGNCFYSYFHAVVLAEKHRAAIIAPPWLSLKLGPLLRRERSKRFYWRMFRPFAGEIAGVKKLLTLLAAYRRRVIVHVGGPDDAAIVAGALNFVVSRKFTFVGLHPHRATIRERMLGTVNDPVPRGHCWGRGDYIAVHIRMGDFVALSDDAVVNANRANVRIPVGWYANIVRALQRRYGQKPILIFSDGDETALRPVLDCGATLYRSGSDMTDLLALAGASVLVGSNSTYSRWAAFLGDMPSIWLKTAELPEKPSSPDAPILYVPLETGEPDLWDHSPFEREAAAVE